MANNQFGRGLVSYFNMNEGTGSVAYDCSGRNNTGTVALAPTWTTGKKGKCLSFGASQRIMINNPLTTSKSAFTFSFWTYQTGGGNRCMLSMGGSNDSGAIYAGSAGTLNFVYYSGGYRMNIANQFTLNTWYHVTLVGDGAADGARTLTLYMNGIPIGTPTIYNYAFSVGGLWAIGANQSLFSENTTGKIDDVRIYNRALSQQEITSLYNSYR